MEIDLSVLNTKPKIIINTKVNFPKEDLDKAGILSMNEIHIQGEVTSELEEYFIKLNIKGKMVLPCSLTLEPVDYPFTLEIEENLNEMMENFKKTQKTIDILPIIWENILMEIPMKIVSPKAKNMKTKGDGWELITDSEPKANSSLAKLKDLL